MFRSGTVEVDLQARQVWSRFQRGKTKSPTLDRSASCSCRAIRFQLALHDSVRGSVPCPHNTSAFPRVGKEIHTAVPVSPTYLHGSLLLRHDAQSYFLWH